MPKSRKSQKTALPAPLSADVLVHLNQNKMDSDQIAVFLTDNVKVRAAAEAIGTTLSCFQSGPNLELYFDIEKQGEEMGFVSKGWTNSGFIVGDVLPVTIEHRDTLRKLATKIKAYGAANGVTVDINLEEGEIACVGLNIVLSKDSFNSKSLSKSLDTIRATVSAIDHMLTLQPGTKA